MSLILPIIANILKKWQMFETKKATPRDSLSFLVSKYYATVIPDTATGRFVTSNATAVHGVCNAEITAF